MGSIAIQPKVQPLVLGGGATMPPVKMRAGPLHLYYKLCIPRSTRDRHQCNYHSLAAFTNYSIAFGLYCYVKSGQAGARAEYLQTKLSDDQSSR